MSLQTGTVFASDSDAASSRIGAGKGVGMVGTYAAAAALTAALGVAHSVLGQRFVIGPLLRRGDLPRVLGSEVFTRRTLLYAWHATSLAWLGLAATLLVVAVQPRVMNMRAIAVLVQWAVLATAALALVVTRGRHPSWIVLVAIAILIGLGVRSDPEPVRLVAGNRAHGPKGRSALSSRAEPTMPPEQRAERTLPRCDFVAGVGPRVQPPRRVTPAVLSPVAGDATGVVIVETTIDASGVVTATRVLRGEYRAAMSAADEERARTYVGEWTFEPAVWVDRPITDEQKQCSMLPGDPVAVELPVPVRIAGR